MAESLRERVPLAVPPLWVNEAVDAKIDPSLETSKPDGADAIMLAVRLLPEIEKVWAAEAVP